MLAERATALAARHVYSSGRPAAHSSGSAANNITSQRWPCQTL
jgi:hypothetical protein